MSCLRTLCTKQSSESEVKLQVFAVAVCVYRHRRVGVPHLGEPVRLYDCKMSFIGIIESGDTKFH